MLYIFYSEFIILANMEIQDNNQNKKEEEKEVFLIRIDDEKIAKILTANEIFDFRPGMLIKDLGLTKPKGWSYRGTSNYGHFGREGFPWEKTDRAAALRSAAGVK